MDLHKEEGGETGEKIILIIYFPPLPFQFL